MKYKRIKNGQFLSQLDMGAISDIKEIESSIDKNAFYDVIPYYDLGTYLAITEPCKTQKMPPLSKRLLKNGHRLNKEVSEFIADFIELDMEHDMIMDKYGKMGDKESV